MNAAPSWSFAADGMPIKAEAAQSLRQAGGRPVKPPSCCCVHLSKSTTVVVLGSFIRIWMCPRRDRGRHTCAVGSGQVLREGRCLSLLLLSLGCGHMHLAAVYSRTALLDSALDSAVTRPFCAGS